MQIYNSNEMAWGINSEKQIVPDLHNSITNNIPKVLEVGPGTGPTLPKIINIYGSENVYAMQPLVAEYSSYNHTVRDLLLDNYFIEDSLENYSTKEPRLTFDIIYIYKWNIDIRIVDDFINGLRLSLNPGGIIYITSVEKERFHKADPYMNLIHIIEPYFNIATSIQKVETYEYGVIKLTHKL